MQKIIHYSKSLTQTTILKHNSLYKAIFNLLKNKYNLKNTLQDYQHIYIDVSIYANSDTKTGIQRVIREVIFQVLQDTVILEKIKFVIATQKVGYRAINYYIQNGLPIFDIQLPPPQNFINPSQDDIFLGLDFCPNIIPYHLTTFLKWKLKGVALTWLLYDLLPVSNPEWFTPHIQKNFIPWLKSIALVSDNILCISKTVEEDMRQFALSLDTQPNLSTIRLGQGFKINEKNPQSFNLPNIPQPYVMMVGTLEPRKGHNEIIQAFSELWEKNEANYALILVGKKGWLTETLIDTIETHVYYNHRLFWFKDIDDESLKVLYESSSGVIIASFNEGYGLPLIEALGFNKPVFARDIPIFHEISQNNKLVTFFNSEKMGLDITLLDWLKQLEDKKLYPSQLLKINHSKRIDWDITWHDIKRNMIGNS